MFLPLKPSVPLWTAALGAFGFVAWITAWCPQVRADDPPPPPVWLGDPGVDVAKARERDRSRYEAAQRWETDDTLAAYERVGKKDPRWDEAARETLRYSFLLRADQPGGPATEQAQKTACARAVALGCDDPLIAYLALRTGNYPPGTSLDEQARLYTDAERNLAASDYPPLRKYHAAIRAAEQALKRRRDASGLFGGSEAGEDESAVGWAPGTDIRTAYRHGLIQLEALWRDPAVPAALYYGLTVKFMNAASRDPIGRQEVLRPLEDFYTGGGPKEQAPAVAKLFEGRFWFQYAWDARPNEEATPPQATRFLRRMDKSLGALQQAWALDPSDPEVAYAMLRSSCDRVKPQREVERWFRRAMDTRPDSYEAADAYTQYPSIYWGGSGARLLAFGRQCLATRDVDSRLPLILLTVHKWLAERSGRPAKYWRRPEVWTDVHDLYACLTAARPDVLAYAAEYAVLAARARQWNIAQAQFAAAGDVPDPGALCFLDLSATEYQDLRRETAENVAPAR